MHIRLTAPRSTLWLLVLAMVLTGCGKARLATYPTTGKVLVDGKPAAMAQVLFCPVSGSSTELQKQRPFGVTDESGTYSLTTFSKGDGAPEGEYTVMVRWGGPNATKREDASGRRVSAADVLKGKYFDPDKSGLGAKVAPGTNQVPAFELSTKLRS